MKEVEITRPMVHYEQKPFQRVLMEVMSRTFAPKVKVHGIENLTLIDDVMRPTFLSNHISHADYPIFAQALKRKGFGRIEKKTIPLQGLRIEGDPVRQFLLPAFNTIRIWPQTIQAQTDEDKKKQFAMTRKALQYAKWNTDNGYYPFIFPEGTRSRDNQLQRGVPEVIHFLNSINITAVIPLGIYGTENMLPIGRGVPIPSIPHVVFRKPISFENIKERYKYLPRKERWQAMMDFFMKEIADCLPEKYQGVYAKT